VENTALKRAVEGWKKKEEGVEEEKGDRRSLVEKIRSKGEDEGERRRVAEKVRNKDEEEGEIRREIQCQSQCQSRTETPTRSGRPPKRLGQGPTDLSFSTPPHAPPHRSLQHYENDPVLPLGGMRTVLFDPVKGPDMDRKRLGPSKVSFSTSSASSPIGPVLLPVYWGEERAGAAGGIGGGGGDLAPLADSVVRERERKREKERATERERDSFDDGSSRSGIVSVRSIEERRDTATISTAGTTAGAVNTNSGCRAVLPPSTPYTTHTQHTTSPYSTPHTTLRTALHAPHTVTPLKLALNVITPSTPANRAENRRSRSPTWSRFSCEKPFKCEYFLSLCTVRALRNGSLSFRFFPFSILIIVTTFSACTLFIFQT
jgi:hypothetical protein